jgi:hypothetical protein
MAEIRDALSLDRDDLPDCSTIYKSFDRLKMWVWRALLRVLVYLLNRHSGKRDW